MCWVGVESVPLFFSACSSLRRPRLLRGEEEGSGSSGGVGGALAQGSEVAISWWNEHSIDLRKPVLAAVWTHQRLRRYTHIKQAHTEADGKPSLDISLAC